LSEATGLVLFVEYLGSLAFSATPGHWRPRKLTFRAFLVGTCLDGTVSLLSIADEYTAHARAVPVQAQVVAGAARVQRTGPTRFTFTCLFQDHRGAAHAAWFSDLGQGVPIKVQQAITGGQLPVETAVAYDPQWPGRTWLADMEYSDDNRLFFYSLLSIIVSGGLTLGLMGLNEQCRFLPPAGSGPFLGMTVLFCCVGFLQGW
jgi:hypothetical protein